ncbi:unnamed protein product [Schistosoma mattheei]|uniref:Uncharacterized protein n=2 Tax=Schistosoma TaxID=6181 RepID=A0A183L2V0_9TREM|nr:unnamed protein product [Schistosoma mattheei]VDP76107.1 unnamed protein product [Schistosoma curassoni]
MNRGHVIVYLVADLYFLVGVELKAYDIISDVLNDYIS